jgi:2'-5' RNA ligase
MTQQPRGRAGWESAVVVRVPALDQTVDELRRRFHLPLKPNGIRPHITSLIPFLPAAELGEEGELPALRALCAGLEPFDVSFARTARFPRVLYLAPEPAEPFIALTRALMARWPQLADHAGERKQVVPHLTVTTSRPPRVFHAVNMALAPQLPVSVRIDAAQVYLFDGRAWTEHASLPFGPT